jgi:ABC-type glutathione transport system ATPase component
MDKCRLKLRSVHVQFPQTAGGPARHVLAGVSLDLNEGECLGLLGLSGDGKSTLRRVAEGALPPSRGEVHLRTPTGWLDLYRGPRRDIRAARRFIGVVDQIAELNPRRRVLDLVTDPLAIHGLGDRRERRRRAEHLLCRVGLDGYGGREAAALSGGQLQRVAIARALIAHPPVLLLDEPTSALDVLNTSELVRLLDGLLDERRPAVLMVTHDLAIVRHLADRVAILDRGQVCEEASADVMFENPLSAKARLLLKYARQTAPARPHPGLVQ